MVRRKEGAAGQGLIAAALAAALAACGPGVVPYRVVLTLDTCGGPSPTEGVTHYQFRISGDQMEPLEAVAVATAHRQDLPNIPAGTHRRIEVRAYAGDPGAGGRLISLGRSLPFNIPTAVPIREPDPINIFLRRINAFTPTSISVAAGTCSHPRTGRAGHTATVLRDGRVLLAGGYQLSPGGQPMTLASAELYDPATGAFSDAPDLGTSGADPQANPSPRAYHTATLLPTGAVLLAGGEVAGPSGAPTPPIPLKSALVYDPKARAWRSLDLSIPRSHHGAAADSAGRVLLLGGTTSKGGLAGQGEWFDPGTGRTALIPDALARTGMAVAASGSGAVIAAVGGTDGITVSDEARFYSFDGNTFSPASRVLHLTQKRRNAGLAPFGDGSRLVVVGGFDNASDATALSPLSASELLDTQSGFNVGQGPAFSGRGDACTATLPDGRVLAVAGQTADPNRGPRLDDSVELLTVLPSTGAVTVLGMPAVPGARYDHTCTALPDGTVLVLGGVGDSGSGPDILQDAQIFTPAPLD